PGLPRCGIRRADGVLAAHRRGPRPGRARGAQGVADLPRHAGAAGGGREGLSRGAGPVSGPRVDRAAAPADLASLELSPERMRALGEQVLERVVQHLASLDRQPACGDTAAQELCRSLRAGPPEHGAELEALLAPLFEQWVGRSFNTAGPGYLAFIPGGGLFASALADFIADATNRYTGVWQAAPALVQLEANVLEWLRDWMGFPPETRGLFTTG